MRKALEAAEGNMGAPFGSAIIDASSGREVASGCNRAHEDPTLHGEIVSLQAAARRVERTDWPRLILCTTAEPCPMCASACLWAGLGAVIYDVSIPWLARHGWRQINIRCAEVFARSDDAAPDLVGGILHQECATLFERAQ